VSEKRKDSASGEAAAIGGYWKQYEYSACIIYQLMQNGILEAITIADASAGIFDDLLVHTGGEIHATQVKSEKNPGYVNLASALKKGSLIQDMAESWKGLRAAYSPKKVRLKYIFAGFFSKNDASLANKGSSGAKHSAEFARVISQYEGSSGLLTDSKWSNKLAELRAMSGLQEPQFRTFLADLELCDSSERERNRIAIFSPEDRSRIEEIRALIPTLVAEHSEQNKWSEQELIDRLGWKRRIRQHNYHQFPVPRDFQQNESTERQLLEAIARTTSGYLALTGPPGTGKSTLLQRDIHSTPDYSVSRYLAFVPDQRHGLGRAEAGEFLNDLIGDLRGQGFYGSRFANDLRSALRDEFRRQLEQASERYQESGRKTLIVIDGLDHVPREENPESSFLRELPATEAIPPGVLFLLGTQRIDLPDLHSTIIQQANKPERRVTIEPLPRTAIFTMAKLAGLPEDINRDEIYDACQGHPLTARYFIEALKNVSPSEAERVLSHADGLGQSLEEIYQRVWAKLGTTQLSKSALGLLARAEETLSLEQLASASSDEAVEEVLEKAGFLLSRERGRLAIFHNSFRLFVAGETRKKFGEENAEIEGAYNRKLAEISACSPDTDPQKRKELRYRSRAGDTSVVLDLGTPEYFRGALAEFYPPSEIYTDLRLTFGAVKPTRDRVILLNKLLISKEIEYRLEAVSDLDLVGLFLDLGKTDLAIQHALEGSSQSDGWLHLVDHLWEEQQHELARQVFEANEPLELLFSNEGFDPVQDLGPAERWIQRAQRFRPIEKLSALIDSIVIQPSRLVNTDDDSSSRHRLKYALALGAVLDQRAPISELRASLGLSDEDVAMLWVETALWAYDNGENDAANAAIDEAVKMAALPGLHYSWRLSLGLIAFRLGKMAAARQLATTLSLPRLNGDSSESGNLVREIYEIAFLAEGLGANIAEEPATERGERSELLHATRNKLIELGTLRAKVASKDAVAVVPSLKTIILFFANASPASGDFQGYKFHAAVGQIAHIFLSIAKKLDEQYFRDVVTFIDQKVSDNSNNLSRSQNFRLDFATLLHGIDGDTEAARSRIEAARAALPIDRTPQEVVDSCVAFGRAFSQIGLLSEAEESINEMHQDTFGYWLRAKKEPQYQFWAWSYLKACEAAPDRVEISSLTFAQFILGMDETEGDETAMRLIGDLIRGAGSVPKALAGIILRLRDSDLTTWARIADSVLASIAERNSALAASVLLVFGRLVIPFYHAELDRCIPACLEALGPSGRAESARVLLSSVDKWCPPSMRPTVLKLIEDSAPELASTIAASQHKVINLSEMLDQLAHGSNRETTERGYSIDIEASSLSDLLTKGDGKSDYGDGVDYSYARAAERLGESSTLEEIEEFLTARPHLERDAKVMVAFARAMLRADKREKAIEFFQKAETAAGAGHWSSFLGGQKLEVQRLRVELEGLEGRERGFDILVEELASGQAHGTSLFLNLDKILELITSEAPYEAFWAETENHLKQYREFRLAAPVEPYPAVNTHTDLLAFLASLAFDFSCPEILHHARSAAELVAAQEEDGTFLSKLIELLRLQSDGARESAALLYHLRHHHHLREALLDEARKFTANDDFIVHTLAKLVLWELGEDYEEPTPTSLPAYYNLVTTDSDQASNFDPPPGLLHGQRPMWVDDPWSWTSLLKFPFNVLSDSSGFSLDLLRRRCASFMRAEGGRDAFGPEVEKEILARLRRMDLQFAYRRPLPAASMRGFGKLLMELDRAGAVNPQASRAVWEDIGGPPLRFSHFELSPRPEWVKLPDFPRRQYGGFDAGEWLSNAEQSLNVSVGDGFTLLADETFVRVKAWRETVGRWDGSKEGQRESSLLSLERFPWSR
jgi:hypothetical protein